MWLTRKVGRRVHFQTVPLSLSPSSVLHWLAVSLQHSLCSLFSLNAFRPPLFLPSVLCFSCCQKLQNLYFLRLPLPTSLWLLSSLHKPICHTILGCFEPCSHLELQGINLCDDHKLWPMLTISCPMLLYFFINLCSLVPILPVISWLLSLDPVVSPFKTTVCVPGIAWTAVVTGSVWFNPWLHGVYWPVMINSHPILVYPGYALCSVRADPMTFSSAVSFL